MAPVQGYAAGIPWDMHLRAYDAYCKRFGRQEALIQGGCRGGFGDTELDMFIPGWRDELSVRSKLERELAEVKALEQASLLERQDVQHLLNEADIVNDTIEDGVKQLVAQLATAQEDQKRLDWLELTADGANWQMSETCLVTRAAIDAAMKENQE